jgi:hypothetical protein
LLYALFFGWWAWGSFETGQFYHPEFRFKDCYSPEYLDYAWVISTAALALLFLSGLIGGCGLIGLRPWVRRWEIAYLGLLSVGVGDQVVKTLASDQWMLFLTPIALFTIFFALPFVPFLFGVVDGRCFGRQGRSST